MGRDALRGDVFVDPTAEKPYLFHLARLTVVRKADPEIADLAHEETVVCRLVGVRQTEGAGIAVCPVEHLLLLRGGEGLPPQAQRLAVAATKLREQANAYLMERVCRGMAVERRNQMMAALPERESFVERGFDFQEAELAASRAKLTPKAREGNKGAAAELSRIKDQQRELRNRRDRALAIIRREPELLVPGNTDFIAHALVVPSAAKADRERLDANVEQIAMNLVKAYEEASGATVRFVHTPELARAAGLPENPGFDILSVRPGLRNDAETRRLGDTGSSDFTGSPRHRVTASTQPRGRKYGYEPLEELARSRHLAGRPEIRRTAAAHVCGGLVRSYDAGRQASHL